MAEPIKLSDLLDIVLPHAPETFIDEQFDGNIVLVLNKKLDADQSRLVDFEDEDEEES